MKLVLPISLIVLLTSACGSGRSGPQVAEMKLTSLSFGEGGLIPERHTCDAGDISPQLAWADVPSSASSLVLIVDDPDAPGGVFVHWVVYDLPPGVGELLEDADPLSVGAQMGVNGFDQTAYRGPCPPSGEHRYFFKLFALDVELGDMDQPTANEVLAAAEGHLVGTGGLMGTYSFKP